MYEYTSATEGGEVVAPKPKKTVRVIALLLAILVIFGGSFLFVRKNVSARALFGLKPKTEQEAVSRYLAQLGKLMILPVDDAPVLATVEDPDALIKQQAFFQGSIKGDVVLIFPKTARAILFSPSRDRIVNAGPVIQNDKQKDEQATQQGVAPM